MKLSRRSTLLLGLFVLLDIALWMQIISGSEKAFSFSMLDVGQGDSSLLQFTHGAVILTDAGPDRSVSRVLDSFELPVSKYIDVAVITHPELDHYGGFSDLLDRYDVGVFLVNGRTPDEESLPWNTLLEKIKKKHIPVVVVGEGDSIVQGEDFIRVIAPGREFRDSGALNDTGIVQYAEVAGTRLLSTADIGEDVERHLIRRGLLQIDILKVGHHGSKFSSSEDFLKILRPRLAVIGVGENRYGHPAKEAMSRLRAVLGESVFDTKTYGTVTISKNEGSLRVAVERSP